jgi:DNA-binding PucR family transcriptional regulator
MDDDLAGFLPAAPTGNPPGIVGVGPPRPLERLSESFRLATRSLITAHSFRLPGIHTLERLGLRPAIVSDADVDDVMLDRYITPLGDADGAAEILTTLRVYFACGTHVDTAAQRLFVHPNTVRYRLARFEKLTGADLHDIQVAFEVWWALEGFAMRTARSDHAHEAEALTQRRQSAASIGSQDIEAGTRTGLVEVRADWGGDHR